MLYTIFGIATISPLVLLVGSMFRTATTAEMSSAPASVVQRDAKRDAATVTAAAAPAAPKAPAAPSHPRLGPVPAFASR